MVLKRHLALDPTALEPPDAAAFEEGAPFVTADGRIFVKKSGAWELGAGAGFDPDTLGKANATVPTETHQANVVLGKETRNDAWITGVAAFDYWHGPSERAAGTAFETYATLFPSDGTLYGNERNVMIGAGQAIMPRQAQAVAIGAQVVLVDGIHSAAQNIGHTVVGASSKASGESVVVGYFSDSGSAPGNIVVGSLSSTGGRYDTVIGYGSSTGKTVENEYDTSTLMARSSLETGNVLIGLYTAGDDQLTGAVIIGQDATARGKNSSDGETGGTARFEGPVSIGQGAYTQGNYNIAIGRYSNSRREGAIAIGYQAFAQPGNAFTENPVLDKGGIAIGAGASTRGRQSVVIGSDAAIPDGHHRSVALGYSAYTNKADQIILGGTDGESAKPVVTIFSGLLELPTVDVTPSATAGTPTLFVDTNGALRFRNAAGTLQTVTVT